MHFYGEDRRAQEMARALEAGDVEEFAALAGRSGLSSDLCLQNTRGNQPRNQAVALALALGRELAGQRGTVRVHGGGFAGTILAVLPRERLEPFRRGMEEVFGAGAVRVLRIRDRGGCLLGESCRTVPGRERLGRNRPKRPLCGQTAAGWPAFPGEPPGAKKETAGSLLRLPAVGLCYKMPWSPDRTGRERRREHTGGRSRPLTARPVSRSPCLPGDM